MPVAGRDKSNPEIYLTFRCHIDVADVLTSTLGRFNVSVIF